MIDHHSQTHLFSFYASNFIQSWCCKVGDVVIIQDEALLHRMVKIVRLGVSDQAVLFDQQFHVLILIQKISKKE